MSWDAACKEPIAEYEVGSMSRRHPQLILTETYGCGSFARCLMYYLCPPPRHEYEADSR